MSLNNLFQMGRSAVRWNPPAIDGTVKRARECTDHPDVKPTDYIEVTRLSGPFGSLPDGRHWPWTVMGVLETIRGRQLVCPGDWIIEPIPGLTLVLSDVQYHRLLVNEIGSIAACS